MSRDGARFAASLMDAFEPPKAHLHRRLMGGAGGGLFYVMMTYTRPPPSPAFGWGWEGGFLTLGGARAHERTIPKGASQGRVGVRGARPGMRRSDATGVHRHLIALWRAGF